jgi:hypothetical protein
MFEPTEEQCQRGLLVQLELKEALDRMRAEGFAFEEITAGLASLCNEVIASEHNQATSSAWFFGMAKWAATMAADQMSLGKPRDH